MFHLYSDYHPAGDQPKAIKQLVGSIESGRRHQVLLGVTGSGKTFAVAKTIAKINRPTLVIAHNKTLAAQLYQEYRDFFPKNAVSYFVSYYDYYQPEAYIPQTDTYIEKETDVNELIDKLRLQATTNLLTRKDVIVVASVSCIYNLGSPAEYERSILTLKVGGRIDRRELMLRLIELMYSRNDQELSRGTFRVRGNNIDVWLAYEDKALRIVLAGDGISDLFWIDPVSSQPVADLSSIVVYPAKHYIANPELYQDVFRTIRQDLVLQVKKFESAGKMLEARRLAQKVEYELSMIQEVGYVNGIENYSRYFDGREPGEPPFTLLEYFKHSNPNFLTVIDESHMTIPQLRGMYLGDLSRKRTLIDYGFRLPAAIDNRPLKFDEFLNKVNQVIYTSATPGDWEMEKSKVDGVVELLVRPTGLVDPEVEIRPAENQVPDLVMEILKRRVRHERVLVTTLTKKTAEALTEYLNDDKKIQTVLSKIPQIMKRSLHKSLSVAYLHSDIKTLDRQDTLDKLRKGEVDVVVGINLLREGLDLPEVSLVAILDADQEGFLRSKTSLIQTMGRASRNVEGRVILYARQITRSMREAIEEVNRRRKIQVEFNLKHNIFPKSIVKPIREKIVAREETKNQHTDLPKEITRLYGVKKLEDLELESLSLRAKKTLIRHLSKEMLAAADRLDFEQAAKIRDKIAEIKKIT